MKALQQAWQRARRRRAGITLPLGLPWVLASAALALRMSGFDIACVVATVALLMALQAGLPPLDFSPLAGRGRPAYIAVDLLLSAISTAALTLPTSVQIGASKELDQQLLR